VQSCVQMRHGVGFWGRAVSRVGGGCQEGCGCMRVGGIACSLVGRLMLAVLPGLVHAAAAAVVWYWKACSARLRRMVQCCTPFCYTSRRGRRGVRKEAGYILCTA
jgi:hypothetical protein